LDGAARLTEQSSAARSSARSYTERAKRCESHGYYRELVWQRMRNYNDSDQAYAPQMRD
jgi:ribosomal protein L37E